MLNYSKVELTLDELIINLTTPLSLLNNVGITNFIQVKNVLDVTPLTQITLNFIEVDGSKSYFINFFSNNFFNDCYSTGIERALISEEDSLNNIILTYREECMLGELYFFFEDEENEANAETYISAPELKLYYPEPFIASPSFVHEEVWFIHILHYNYWLWFFFISLIMFYFITFINVVRWCNLRSKPKRETRGVSRSKCADLITAIVPVSWAISIIISETVDATDYYDGFGTGEIVIGIRAYQWGWEYFYPKNIDLNYDVKPSYSTMLGNSLKYCNQNSNSLDKATLWKYYQNKSNTSQLNTPAHLLLTPSDSLNHLNTLDFSNVGNSVQKDSNAFGKIQKFSKLTSNGLPSDVTSNNNTFKKLNNLYLDTSFSNSDSHSYGTTRQHNYSSLNTLLPSFSSLIDNSSLKKFLSNNINYNRNQTGGLVNKFYTNAFNISKLPSQNETLSTSRYLENHINISENFNNYILLKWPLLLGNNGNKFSTTDGTFYKNPGIANNRVFSKKLHSKIGNSIFTNDLTSTLSNNYLSWNLFNEARTYKFKDTDSKNLQFLTAEKNLRYISNIKLSNNNLGISATSNLLRKQINDFKLGNITSKSYLNTLTNNSDPSLLNNLMSTNFSLSGEYNPLSSSNPAISKIQYDKLSSYSNEEVPELFKGKEESSLEYLFNSHWSSFFKSKDMSNIISKVVDNLSFTKDFCLMPITEYAEYDFANWQALESLEDSIWESSYPIFLHEEYTDSKKAATEGTYYDKIQTIYNQGDRSFFDKSYRFKRKLNFKSFLNTNIYSDYYSSVELYTPGFFNNLGVISLKNFSFYSTDLASESLEVFYNNVKNLKFLNYTFSKNFILAPSNTDRQTSYAHIFDAFSASFDESGWDINFKNFSLDSQNFTSNIDSNSFLLNPFKLRKTTKNSIVAYNSIQKVYKSRFDDGRANLNFNNFSNSYLTQSYITENKINYEKILGKNKESFFNTDTYNTFYKNFNSDLLSSFNLNNSVFINIPFLLSMKSDAARYLWFDWQARWSSIEVQPSSIARFSLINIPYFSKKTEVPGHVSDVFSESENYFTKISRARRNYMPNWIYSPYFLNRVTKWFHSPNYGIYYSESELSNTKLVLGFLYKEVKNPIDIFSLEAASTLTNSHLSRINNVSWSPINELASYYYSTSTLLDILSKRELLYRLFFKNSLKVVSIPKFLTVSPDNSLIKDIKSTYSFIDPTTFSSEITRELLYSNSDFLKYSFTRDVLKILNSTLYKLPINFDFLNNYFIYFLSKNTSYTSTSLNKNLHLFKSQYRPMRKGIANMIRLQATNAIAMPTEIRLHILASSKDVIHSWAIPSAGIKIDCVPGYSSHRVMIFLTHGIFWGQCMEICGRYHHWMPIVVYFMKRDLFFLWCTHFIHYSTVDQTFLSNTKNLSNYVNLVSHSKNIWV